MLNISGIHEGFVLDHIQAGMSLQIYHDLKLDQLDCPVAIIKNAKRGECLYRCGTDRHILKVVAPEYKAKLFKRQETGQNTSQNPQEEAVPK